MTDAGRALTVELSTQGRALLARYATYELRITEPGRRERVLHVRQASLRIGSHQSCDLPLSDPGASRIHAEIALDPKGFRLRDLGSTNGTFVNGVQIIDAYLPKTATLSIGHSSLEFRALPEQVEEALPPEDGLGPLVGKSAAMLSLFQTVRRVAGSDFTVLLQGESGTGKELVAETIHAESARKDGPFVVFDCAAVPPGLIESELFGHEKGAFTGAAGRRIGVLEQAKGGTIFLDEIGDLPLELQPKLLRALEKREVRPVGGSDTKKLDVRIIAATHRELAEAVNAGTFREDLYYRLAVVRVEIPPLRTRLEDLELLVPAILSRALPEASAAEALLRQLSEATWARLKAHRWPGNVRELRNVVERMVVFAGDVNAALDPLSSVAPSAGGAKLEAETHGERIDAHVQLRLDAPWLPQKAALVEALERRYFEETLEKCGGSITKAAASAQIDRAYFRRMLKKYR